MAWQTVVPVEGQVRGLSLKARRAQSGSLDRGCISLNSAWGQGALLGGRRRARLFKDPGSGVLTTGTQGQKARPFLASRRLGGDLLVDPGRAACSR